MFKPWLYFVLLLGGCSLLEPRHSLEAITPKTELPLLQVIDLPFISPSEVGSWVAVTPEEFDYIPRDTPGMMIDDLGFTGLKPLIDAMLAENPSLQQVQANFTQAQALARVSLAPLLPSLSANGSVLRHRQSPGQIGQGATNLPTENRSSIGVAMALPIDLFGRFTGQFKSAKRLKDRADADVQATVLALKASMAQTYIQLLAAHRNTRVWQRLIEAAEEQNRLTQLRYAAGDLPLTSTEPVFATLQNLRVQALAAAQTEQQLQYTLAALQGQSPRLYRLSEDDLGRLDQTPVVPPTRVSSTALLTRPDVRSAAAQMAAANANIGVARAAFLPQISLTGEAGFTAGQNSNLLNWNNRTWSVGPVVSLPIFQGGANRANLVRAWGQYEQAVAIYRESVLGAYQETANAFTFVQVAQNRAQSARDASRALDKAAEAMNQRYQIGDVSKIESLTASIVALQAQITATSAVAAHHAAVIELARSLGGGWKVGQH